MTTLSKKELLKVFTKIPNEFIEDFYNILSKNNEPFPISLDIVSKWLQSRKTVLFETLKLSYRNNEDYMVDEAYIKGGKGGKAYKRVLLTVDCFKRLCMRSRSAKAEEVRTYFIELDDFITHYSDQISDGIIRDIENVAKRVKKNPNKDGPGYIYAIKASQTVNNLVKIGETEELIARLRAYNTGRAEDVELLYAFRTENRKQVEACVKGLMESKRYKKRREIYEIDMDILKKIINGCHKMSMEMKAVNPNTDKTGKYYILFMKKGGGELYDEL